MINITDLQECEVLLPGDWVRRDNKSVYSFTTGKMEMREDGLYRELIVVDKDHQRQEHMYAIAIQDDYCAVLVDGRKYLIKEISRTKGNDGMIWESSEGSLIEFDAS